MNRCIKCTRVATSYPMAYSDGWLCTFHANKAIKEGRIEKKLNKLKNN